MVGSPFPWDTDVGICGAASGEGAAECGESAVASTNGVEAPAVCPTCGCEPSPGGGALKFAWGGGIRWYMYSISDVSIWSTVEPRLWNDVTPRE